MCGHSSRELLVTGVQHRHRSTAQNNHHGTSFFTPVNVCDNVCEFHKETFYRTRSTFSQPSPPPQNNLQKQAQASAICHLAAATRTLRMCSARAPTRAHLALPAAAWRCSLWPPQTPWPAPRRTTTLQRLLDSTRARGRLRWSESSYICLAAALLALLAQRNAQLRSGSTGRCAHSSGTIAGG